MPPAAVSETIGSNSCSLGTTQSYCPPCPQPCRTCTRSRIFGPMERPPGDAGSFGIFDERSCGDWMGCQMLA